MILLVGASGRLGQAVARRLLADGLVFRAACRDVAKARWLEERGVEVVRVDVETGAGVAQAMVGATRVLACLHGLMGRSSHAIDRVDIQGQQRLIDGAVEARVGRFVFVSALGASPDHPSEFWRAKAWTEQYLRGSGLEYVILRPSAFMDLYAHELIGAAILRGKPVILLGDGNSARNLVAVADVGEAAVKALLQDDLAGKIIDVGGYDNLTERQVAAIYERVAGRPAKLRSIPPAALRVLAAVIAPFHAGVARILRLPLVLAGREDLCLDPAASIAQLNIEPVRLAQFAEAKRPA